MCWTLAGPRIAMPVSLRPLRPPTTARPALTALLACGRSHGLTLGGAPSVPARPPPPYRAAPPHRRRLAAASSPAATPPGAVGPLLSSPAPGSSTPSPRSSHPAAASALATATSALPLSAADSLDGVLQLRREGAAKAGGVGGGGGGGGDPSPSAGESAGAAAAATPVHLTDRNGVPYTGEQAAKEAARRAKISAAAKGRLPWNTGQAHSPETKAKIRAATQVAMGRPDVVAKMQRKAGTRR